MNGIDLSLFRAINGMPDTQAPFWVFFSEATHNTAGILILVLTFIGLVVWSRSRVPALLVLLAFPLADGTTKALKYGLQWNRPSWPDVLAAHPEFHMRVEASTGFGTASAHSANMMAVAVCFLWLCRPVGWFWLMIALLTGVSRIYVGEHWPSEVLFGWICGALAGTVVVKMWAAAVSLRNRRKSGSQESQAADP